MSKQYNTKLQERLEKFLKDENLSQAKAAPILGISQAALSQYRRSMYDKGDIEAVENKLKHRFFDGCDNSKYSSVCDAFDEIGMGIFGPNFKENFYDKQKDEV